jgi:hypothetical protein
MALIQQRWLSTSYSDNETGDSYNADFIYAPLAVDKSGRILVLTMSKTDGGTGQNTQCLYGYYPVDSDTPVCVSPPDGDMFGQASDLAISNDGQTLTLLYQSPVTHDGQSYYAVDVSLTTGEVSFPARYQLNGVNGNPALAAYLPDGSLVLGGWFDNGGEDSSLVKLTPDGTITTLLPSEYTLPDGTQVDMMFSNLLHMNLFTDAAGNIYYFANNNGSSEIYVLKFDSNGNLLKVLVNPYLTAPDLSDGAVAPNGDIYGVNAVEGGDGSQCFLAKLAMEQPPTPTPEPTQPVIPAPPNTGRH